MLKHLFLSLPLTLIASCATKSITIDRDVIDDALRARKDDFRACAEHPSKPAKPVGKIIVDFKFGRSGKVYDVATKSSNLDDPKVEQCILDTVRSIEFPSIGAETTTVRYPFSFTP